MNADWVVFNVIGWCVSAHTHVGNLNFQPTPEFPALQYLDSVDPGSQAERAGLRGGDFIMEVGTTGDMLCVHVKSISRYLDQAERAGLQGGDFITEVGTRGGMVCIRVKSISRDQDQAERAGLRREDFIMEGGTRGAMMCIHVKSISGDHGQAERAGLRGGDFIMEVIKYRRRYPFPSKRLWCVDIVL